MHSATGCPTAATSSTKPSPGFRRATEGFNQMWYNLRFGNQSALKGAIYNAVIVAVVAAIVAVCLVLGPFLKPLLWSVLIGAVLFPFKCSLSFGLKRWFARLEEDDTHLLVGVAMAPMEALQALGEYLVAVFWRHMQQLVGGAAALLLLGLFVSYAPKGVAYMLWSQIRWAHTLFTNVLSSIDYTVVIALIAIYVSVVYFVWRPDNSVYFMLAGQTLWVVLIAYACSFLGALQVPIFVAAIAYASAGIVYDLRGRRSDSDAKSATATTAADTSAVTSTVTTSTTTSTTSGLVDKMISLLDVPSFYTTGDLSTPVSSPLCSPIVHGPGESRLGRLDELSASASPATADTTTPSAADQGGAATARPSGMRLDVQLAAAMPTVDDNTTTTADTEDDSLTPRSQSECYFRYLFLACLATVFYNHVWLLFVAAVPIAVHLAHGACEAFAVREVLHSQFAELCCGLQQWVIVRHSAVLPVCLPGVLRLNRKVHRAVRRAMRESIDTASSILMIVLLLVTVIFAGVFCAVEIYSEAITVVRLGNDVVNWTLCHRPELMNMFPEGVTNSMDDVIENAYQYGRTGIGTYVDELLKDADAEQRSQLREQLLSVWDRLVQYWLDRKKDVVNGGGGGGGGMAAGGGGGGGAEVFSGPQVPASAISDQIGEIVNNEELFTVAQQGLIGWVKKNLDILMEVLNSVWVIVQANLSVLTSICWTLFSLFLGGGQAVITFIINSIIFLTALFYLLSSSEERYAPLAAANYLGLASGPRIAQAIETSVSSVLFASAKLALFHGLFTWLTHTIFGARVVFLPAVMASVLAAVPFLGTYWCSLPAFFDLWLIQDRFTLGVILMLVHFVFPSTFVDPAIYADVNGGGHAYLTGLSIAGGMFWLGWEGAIFGPMLLCLLVVMFNLTSNVLKESPSTPRPPATDYRVTNFRIVYCPQYSAITTITQSRADRGHSQDDNNNC